MNAKLHVKLQLPRLGHSAAFFLSPASVLLGFTSKQIPNRRLTDRSILSPVLYNMALVNYGSSDEEEDAVVTVQSTVTNVSFLTPRMRPTKSLY